MADARTMIRKPREVEETRISQKSEIRNLVVGTAEMRESVADLHDEAKELDERALSLELDDRASELAQEDPLDLLSQARTDYGLSWENLAELIGVSSAAVRKWRRDEPISAPNRHRLAKALAFCELLSHRDPRISEPAQWLTEPFQSETTLRGIELYAAGFESQLMAVARQDMSRPDLLDMFDPNWRSVYPAPGRWRVDEGPDGLPAIFESRRESPDSGST